MQVMLDRVRHYALEGGDRLVRLGVVDRCGQSGVAEALDDGAVFHHQGLARQHPPDSGENGTGAGGIFQLQQLIAARRHDLGLHQPGCDQRLRFGREEEAALVLDVIERLDPERVAADHEALFGRVPDRDSEHAAQAIGVADAVLLIEVDRRLAVRPGLEAVIRQFGAEFRVVVDFPVGDHYAAGRPKERLVPARNVHDRQPVA